MNGRLRIILSLGLAVSIFSSPLVAHHGGAAYDADKRVTVKGTVTDWLWSNPHCILQLDTPDDGGQVVHWVTETENPSSMIRSGWTKDSFKVGDEISILLVPPRLAGALGASSRSRSLMATNSSAGDSRSRQPSQTSPPNREETNGK